MQRQIYSPWARWQVFGISEINTQILSGIGCLEQGSLWGSWRIPFLSVPFRKLLTILKYVIIIGMLLAAVAFIWKIVHQSS
jgi:hypothetical protein